MGSEARTRLALYCLLIVTLFSFGQVFDRGSWPGPALLGMALAAGIVIAARRLGIGAVLTLLVSLAGLVWYASFIFRFDDLFYGLPDGAAIAGLGRALTSAYAKSSLDYAPVPLRTGYVLLAVIGMWMSTTIAEIATFRWRRPLVATVPLIALFSLLTIVGTRTNTTFPVLLFLAALLAYLALESAHRLRAWGSWITSLSDRSAPNPGEVSSRLARRMGASCLAAALFSPVFLPAIGDGVLSWRNDVGVGPGTGTGPGGGGIDLLASLQPRLIEQSQTEMFTVEAAQADYWRLTSLTAFDGTVWTPGEHPPRPTLSLEGGLVSIYQPRIYEPMTQDVTVRGLQGQLLPAAIEPDNVMVTEVVAGRDDDDLTYELETGAIHIRGGGLTPDLRYRVSSQIARPSFRQLNRSDIAAAPGTYYDTGPIAISPQVNELVEAWTSEFDTPLRKLAAVQDNLRRFTYSVDVPASASTDHLSDFLLRTRRGYCQQFAAAFALIARHLGFPSRVSVGFLPGETGIARPDRFLVRGTDAHAWPEVLFEGYGWVRFEPTPGNGAAPPGYTSRVVPFQVNNPFSDTGASGGGQNPATLAGNQNIPTGGRDRGAAGETATGDDPADRSAWQETFARVLTILLLAVLVFIALVPLLKATRTAIRYRRARSPSDIAAAAFAHFETEAADLAAPRHVSETASAFARRIASGHRLPRDRAVELAEIYERATYSAEGVTEMTAARAHRLAAALRKELWTSAPLAHKIRRLFSPESLLARQASAASSAGRSRVRVVMRPDSISSA